MNAYEVLLRPVITEKNTTLAQTTATYVFQVHPQANKHQIKQAVEEIFGERDSRGQQKKVNVVSVRTAWTHAKQRRFGRRLGETTRWKKAYVTLAAGQSIEIFPGV